jgi:DNA-binding CsgD family transcriptional regulator/PAS domain-containing protein
MLSEDKLSGLLDLLYAGVGESDGWHRFLEELTEVAHASMAVLLFFDQTQARYAVNASAGISPEANGEYASYYGKQDVWYLGTHGKLFSGRVFDGREGCPTEKLIKTEFYNDFLVRFDCAHECGAAIEFQPRSNSILSLLRGRSAGPFSEEHLRLLGSVLPHVQRGLQLHRRIIDLRLKSETQSWALDQVSFGIVLLSRDGKTRFANRPATEICLRRNALELKQGGLHAVCAQEDAELQAMIQAAATLSARAKNVRPVMEIAREEGSPLFLAVSRARTAEFLSVAADAVVAVFITDPDRQPRTSAEMLSHLFRLTPAEARLAVILAQGNTVKDSAEQLRVTVQTVRSRLKQVFLKTGTSRQSELIRLLLKLPPAPTPGDSWPLRQ